MNRTIIVVISGVPNPGKRKIIDQPPITKKMKPIISPGNLFLGRLSCGV